METIEKIDFEFKAVLRRQKIVFNNDVPTDTYKITLIRNGKSEDFKFHQSIMDSDWKNYDSRKIASLINSDFASDVRKTRETHKAKTPTKYDVLCCLQKYPVETFEDFCGDFGYDEDSRKAYKTYLAVHSEYAKMARLFSEKELEQLSEEYQ